MTVTYKLDKIFGPAGSSAGMFLIIGGGAIMYYSLAGIIVIVIGAFIGFSSTSTTIDYDNKKIRHTNNIFGLLRLGEWVTIESSMLLGLKRSNKSWRTYSKGPVPLDVTDKDYRIILFGSNRRPIIPIMKARNLKSARNEVEVLCEKLGLNKF